MTNFENHFLNSVRAEFQRYKTLGNKTIDQLSEEELFWQASEFDNSIAIIIKHMAGNMKSRWTNFLEEDGEKPWRHRDTEFVNPPETKVDLIALWEEGWQILFDALDTITSENINNTIKIRGEAHSIPQAINRQLGHYASHAGQIVFIGKLIKGENWKSLSVPRGESENFNKKMFSKHN